jgi:arabinogalactan endo-1,4-beta-galactosidase
MNMNKNQYKKLWLSAAIAMLTALPTQAQKYVGGDMSMLPKYEAANTQYKDLQGKRIENLLDYVKTEAGFNIIRLRLFVNPTGATGVIQDLDYVKTFGQRIKEAGLKLMLDFHYSDYWADPSNQWTPSAWVSLSDEELYQKIYDYTHECLEAMNAVGATPDFIQTGNEISYGMCWGKQGAGQGKRCYTNNDANWPRFRNLLTQAGKACREVCPDAKIIIHTERTNNVSTTKGIYERLATIDYDIIGLSYYPEWHNNLATLTNTLKTCHSSFPDKDIMIVETGYYNNWYPDNATYNFTSTWPASAEGQKKFLDDLVNAVKELEYVKGLLYWFPEENPYNNHVYEPWYNHGLFNPNTGKVVDALFSLKTFAEEPEPTAIQPVHRSEVSPRQQVYDLQGRRANMPTDKHGAYIANGRKVVVK